MRKFFFINQDMPQYNQLEELYHKNPSYYMISDGKITTDDGTIVDEVVTDCFLDTIDEKYYFGIQVMSQTGNYICITLKFELKTN